MPPPDDLPEEGVLLWQRCQRALRRQGTWQDTDATTLELFVRSVLTYRSAQAVAEQTPYATGSKGQITAHPSVRLARAAAADASRAADELLLTPRARSRAAVTPRAGDDDLAALLA